MSALTGADLEELIEQLIPLWETIAAPDLQPNCCIVAAQEASAVLRYFGAPARAVACDVSFHNAAGWALFTQAVPISEWPPEAWSVGASHDDPSDSGGYSGHLVVIIQDSDSGPVLLDLTAPQFARPDKGIEVPDAIALRVPPDLGCFAVTATEADSSIRAHYRLRPDQQAWRSSPDGRAGPRWAGRIIRELRAGRAAS